MSEFLREGYEKSVQWAASLGLPKAPNDNPETETFDAVETKSYHHFFPVKNGYAFYSTYSRQNVTFGEESWGVQMISPFRMPIMKSDHMFDNSASIQWHHFNDEDRDVVTVSLESMDRPERRYLSLYYDNKIPTFQKNRGRFRRLAIANAPDSVLSENLDLNEVLVAHYEHKVSVLLSDTQTQKVLSELTALNYPTVLARLVMEAKIDTDDFDSMLRALTEISG